MNRSYHAPVLTKQQRKVATMLLRAGEVTCAELAPLLQVSREALRQLALKGKINVPEARARYVKQLWKEAKAKSPD